MTPARHHAPHTATAAALLAAANDDGCARSSPWSLARRVAVVVVVVLSVLVLLSPGSALASFSRPFLEQLNGTPTGPGGEEVPFGVLKESGLTGSDTDNENGIAVGSGDNWYVADVPGNAIDEFNPANEFVSQLPGGGNVFGLAVDDSTGHLYTTSNLQEAVAVDNSTNAVTDPMAGVHYIATGEDAQTTVSAFNASEEPVAFKGKASCIAGNKLTGSCFNFTGLVEFRSLAVDASGNIYVGGLHPGEHTEGFVYEFNWEGEPVRTFNLVELLPHELELAKIGSPIGIAVDSASAGHDLLAADAAHEAIDEFTGSGTFLGRITDLAPPEPTGVGFVHVLRGIAVNSRGDLYVQLESYRQTGDEIHSETHRSVDVFGPGAFYPDVVTGEVGGNVGSSAVLGGVVNGEGLGVTDCHFEYLPDTAFKANDVNAVQTVTVAGATGGTFALALNGHGTGATGTGDMVGPATGSGDVLEGSNTVAGLTTATGTFVAGEEITGSGIPAHTTVVSVHPGALVLSASATASGASVALSAASNVITAVNTTTGAFAVGEQVTGVGVPAGTTITSVGTGTLTLSATITASGSGVALSSGIPFDAGAAQVQAALESVPAVGFGGVAVSGAVGGPYTLAFGGPLAHKSVPVLSADASGLTPAGASVSAAISSEGGDGWGHAAVASCEPKANALLKENGNQPVHATVPVAAGTVYDYRLSAATDPAELGGVKVGARASFAAAAAPAVSGVSVGEVSSSFADFHALIDPLGADTTYRFEYVAAAGYDPGAEDPYAAGGSVPVPDADVGAGDSDVSVVAQAAGLLPGTVYHFRLVASSAAGVTVGVDGVFATVPAGAAGLPDGRAYELMTPANKGDAEDMFGAPVQEPQGPVIENFDLGVSSRDGDHFLLLSSAAFGAFPSSGEGSYVFSRGQGGWSERSVASPSLGVQSAWAEVYDPVDFSLLGVHDILGVQLEQALGLLGPAAGPYTQIASAPNGLSTQAREVGASTDLSHVVVESGDHELPLEEPQAQRAKELLPGSEGLYEWAAGGLRLVDVTSEGSLVSKCGAALGLDANTYQGSTHNAVSGDGSRIVFTAPDPVARGTGCWAEEATGPKTPQVYVRVNGEETVEASEPNEGVVQNATTNPPQPALFVGASEDGSKVFFVTRAELTADAVAAGTHGLELYEYDFSAPEGARLTRISGGEAGTAVGNVSTVAAVSADGSTVYFNAAGKLTADSPGGGLYRYDTGTGTTSYVAPQQGYPAETAGSSNWYRRVLNSGENLALDVSADYYTTGDGRFLLFGSPENLTGYQADGHEELYRYDTQAGAGAEAITCVSCNPNGASPQVGATFTRSAVRHDSPAGTTPRPISENGEYVFFDTAESLLPADKNGKIDVYEWHDGTISLITTGQDASDSFFLDSSPEGRDVFFGTHAQLVPQDTDSSGDLYDARIGGGFPAPAPVKPCEGDACQTPIAAPLEATPGSLTFTGAGNLLAPLTPPGKPTPPPPPPTRSQLLAKALKACHAKHNKHQRAACENQAHKHYNPPKGRSSNHTNRRAN